MDKKLINKRYNEIKRKKFWGLVWRFILFSIVMGLISSIFLKLFSKFGHFYTIGENGGIRINISYGLTTIVPFIFTSICNVGIANLFLTAARLNTLPSVEKMFGDTIELVKKNWFNLLIASLISSLFITLGTFFFIIPGIILYFAYSFYLFIIIDEPELPGADALKKSRDMTRGYKFKLFSYILPSFLCGSFSIISIIAYVIYLFATILSIFVSQFDPSLTFIVGVPIAVLVLSILTFVFWVKYLLKSAVHYVMLKDNQSI